MIGPSKTKAFMVALFLAVFTAAVVGVGESKRQGVASGVANDIVGQAADSRAEGAPFAGLPSRAFDAPDIGNMRDLKVFYARRAYPGAPPTIPHGIDASDQIADGCLDCHAKGGYVAGLKAYAPVTPHPDYVACRQCHVPTNEDTRLFKQTHWQKAPLPTMIGAALPGSPPAMPHPLQLHEDCQSCHTGPAAVSQISASHPDRPNCRQCHVPRETEGTFQRAPIQSEAAQ